MDVKLPNGKFIKNVPEGTSKEAIKQKAIEAGLATPADFGDKQYSAFDAAMISAGRTADKLLQGGRELYYGATGNDEQLAKLQAQEAAKDALMKPLEESHPVASVAGSALPYFAVPFGGAAKATGAALSKVPGLAKAGGVVAKSGLADSVLTGAGLSGLEYGSTAGEGAVAGGLGYGLGRAALGIGAKLKPADKIGEKLGMKLTPGQRSGSKALQQLESSMDSMPFTASAGARIKDTNQAILNRAASKAIGEKAEKITPEILDAADNRLGEIFNSVGHSRPVKLSGMEDDIIKVMDDIDDLLPDNMSIADDKLVKRLLRHMDKGAATGKELRALSSKLGNKASKQMTNPSGDRDLAWGLYAVKDRIDDKIASSLDDASRTAYNEARGQYRNLMLLTQKPTNINAAGDVSARSLKSTLARKDKKGYSYGRNKSDLYEATRFANAHPDIVGDSGTATRGVLPWLIAGSMSGGVEHGTADVAKNLAGTVLGGGLLSKYYYADPIRYGAIPVLGRHTSDQTKRLAALLAGRSLLAD